jgi:chromosome segregation ATPase
MEGSPFAEPEPEYNIGDAIVISFERLAKLEAQVRTLVAAREAHEAETSRLRAEIGRLTAEQTACRTTIARLTQCMERQDLALAEMRQRREFEESRAAQRELLETKRQ